MSGARFSILFDKFAELHRALGSFMLDIHTKEHNYKEVHVPLIVNNEALVGTGQLPKFKSDLFELKNKENFFNTNLRSSFNKYSERKSFRRK